MTQGKEIEMDQVMASYINAAFIQRMLRRSMQDETIEVTDVQSKSATTKGENYSSDICRIQVEYTRKEADKKITETKSIILKLAPRDEGVKRTIMEKTGLFDVEIDMMTDTLKKMNEIVGKNHRFNPTVYYEEKKYPGVLFLEDLAPLGFCMTHRQSCLDLDHCLLVLRNLAKFHASSAVLCQREPSHKSLYHKGVFTDEYPEEQHMFFINGTSVFADEIEHWPELGPKYAKKIRELSKNVYSKAIAVSAPRDDEFNVINHGDCWLNNMLFRYNDEGKPIDHTFVDFQLSMYTSPAVDLHYFFSTSPTMHVYEESKQFLLEEYLRTLTNCLKEFGYKGSIPTMDDLQRYLEEREFYAVICSFTILPLVLVEKEKAADINEMIKDVNSYYNPGLKSEAFRKFMIKRVPYFEKRGLLNN